MNTSSAISGLGHVVIIQASITVINVYAISSFAGIQEKSFSTCETIPREDEIIILIDSNAHVRKS